MQENKGNNYKRKYFNLSNLLFVRQIFDVSQYSRDYQLFPLTLKLSMRSENLNKTICTP